MSNVNTGWTIIDASVPVLTYAYSFGPGEANALAVRGSGGIVVVSPPCGAPESAFTELDKHGEVRALVASNAFHYLGVPAWKERYPHAEVFAPAQSIARVEKKTGLTGIRPLSLAAAITGPDVELVDMPHYRTGEVLVRVKGSSGPIWYVTDVIMNMAKLPGFPFSLLFKWTGSGPGLRPNGVASKFMIKDRAAVYAWMRGEIEKAPPTLIVPCHGDAVMLDPPGKRILDILSPD